ncbi:MAG: shikimate kinase [Saprospiraceae bacterium]|jgi:shikimate kinase|tara:strand:- start:285 stop:818 length:534 start_codon:yes stop_codon:yes gene_type:complete
MKGIRSHIVLVGFMGSGKTTVGKLLADALHMEFIDLDSYIEKDQNRTIAEIFAGKGEAYFREVESIALNEILKLSNKVVVSTGGGAPCHLDSMDIIKLHSLSVYLKIGSRRLAERLKNDTERPLLQNKTEKELLSFVKRTLREREKYYSQANFRIRAVDTPEKITKRLTNYILKTNL